MTSFSSTLGSTICDGTCDPEISSKDIKGYEKARGFYKGCNDINESLDGGVRLYGVSFIELNKLMTEFEYLVLDSIVSLQVVGRIESESFRLDELLLLEKSTLYSPLVMGKLPEHWFVYSSSRSQRSADQSTTKLSHSN